jgi:hypothetical protein
MTTHAEWLEIRGELFADDVALPFNYLEPGWAEDDARNYFESGGQAVPSELEPGPCYQVDIFGCKRGGCSKTGCAHYQQRSGLYKTEGLGGLGVAMCARCQAPTLEHADLGQHAAGEPQLVTEAGEMFVWRQLVEEGKVVVKKIAVFEGYPAESRERALSRA